MMGGIAPNPVRDSQLHDSDGLRMHLEMFLGRDRRRSCSGPFPNFTQETNNHLQPWHQADKQIISLVNRVEPHFTNPLTGSCTWVQVPVPVNSVL